MFGQVFYQQLLQRRQPFGDAVFTARKEVWRNHPDDITWGAFQAYGEPGWLAEPATDGARIEGAGSLYVSADEMLDELARMRGDLARRRDYLSARDLSAQVDRLAQSLQQRCPPGWQQLPQMQSALGSTWLELGQ
ncbi:hypothetical protein ACVBEH_26775, partial [Roseateles sp. GG27B]